MKPRPSQPRAPQKPPQRIALERGSAIAAGALLAAAISCTSLREHPMFENAPTGTKNAELPKLYTEAFIEFSGPNERWAGPANWVLHAKATNPPEITISNGAPTPERVPAGLAAVSPLSGGSAQGTQTPTLLSAELMKTRLEQLAQWTDPNGAPNEFRSCLSPIRVKMIRSDGVSSERRGCRVQSPWSIAVSSFINELALYASGEAPALTAPIPPEPAALPAAPTRPSMPSLATAGSSVTGTGAAPTVTPVTASAQVTTTPATDTAAAALTPGTTAGSSVTPSAPIDRAPAAASVRHE